MTENRGGQTDGLAPVIPLFGGSEASVSGAEAPTRDEALPEGVAGAEPTWHATWTAEPPVPVAESADDEAVREAAEALLVKRLRTRSLSEREAADVLRGEGLDREAALLVVDAFRERGYLDDQRLAEQLVHNGIDRKSQGRRSIAQTLVKRGLPREVIDVALAETEDDDQERALEFARKKATSMRSLDRDTALRRLVGQLSRRGFPGNVAMAVARQALDEGAPAGRIVRFE